MALWGCSAAEDALPENEGPLGQMITAAARRSGVPRDLMVAIAQVEGGLKLAPLREAHEDEAIPVAGVLELRHGRYNSLARGASLMGVDEAELISNLDKGTEAGARVLDDLARDHGIDRTRLDAWADVVEELSGHLYARDRIAYRAQVFKALREGGVAKGRGGEQISIPAHPEIPFDLTFVPPALQAQGTPEYPGAIWFDTPQANKWTPGRGAAVKMIAIHDTEGGWNASVATLQNDPGKSVHYIVDADGSRVGQFISEGDTGWHAGNWYYNQRMIGIEHVGYASADDYQTPMYETSAKLVRDIAKRNGLGPNGDGTKLGRDVLVGHQEIPDGQVIAESSPPCSDSPGTCVKSPNYGGAGNHRDPGVYWEWCQYTEIIGDGAHCKCNDAYALFNCVHDLTGMVRCNGGQIEYVQCPAGCAVMPLGVNDECVPVPTTSSGTGGMGGSGGASGAGVGGSGGSDVGAGGEGGQAVPGGSDEESGCSCGVQGGSSSGDDALWLGALGALGVMTRARRRRG